MRQNLQDSWKNFRPVLRYQIAPKSEAKIAKFLESRSSLDMDVDKISTKVNFPLRSKFNKLIAQSRGDLPFLAIFELSM